MTLNRIYLVMLAVLAAAAFRPPYFVEAFEVRIYDLLIKYTAPNQPDPRIVIIGIDQKSLDTFGRWPWPRDVIGRLVSKLKEFGVKVTALDVTFSTQADKGLADVIGNLEGAASKAAVSEKAPEFYKELVKLKEGLKRDEALAGAVGKAGNVVTGLMFYGKDEQQYMEEVGGKKDPLAQPFRIKLVQRDAESRDAAVQFSVVGVEPNIRILQEAGAASGFLNTWPDPSDGVVRAHPMVIEYKGDLYPSIGLAAAALYAKDEKEENIPLQAFFEGGEFAGVAMADYFLPVDAHGRILLRYMGPDSTFPIISAADVMTAPPGDKNMAARLEGKIAFAGATALQLYDLRSTPFGFTAGVEIHANAAANALNGTVISKAAWQNIYDLALTMVVGLILLFTLKRVRILFGVTLTALLFAGLWVFNFYMFEVNMLWLNSVIPSVTIVMGFITVTVIQYLTEQKSKRFIKDAFSRYLSPKVINLIIEKPSLLKLGGEKRLMTAYFSDVAGFTTISEKMPPPQLVLLLNEYLSAMTRLIHEYEGTVDKYIGDAIVAFWGAPLPEEAHAEKALRAAVTMQKKLAEMRAKWRAEGKDELNVRMGLNTGYMVVGNMGSKDRMDYTIMGDAVNLASRLEGVNKYYGSNILVSEFTLKLVRGLFLYRELDMVRVQGKKEAIRLYEVMTETENATEGQRRFVQSFALALITFRAMNFKKAVELFTACDRLREGGDGACKLYLKRCAELISSPPSADWDRVYDMAK
ncbi:MAG: adenylate/guanylate cyclase domain-containing protein [Nitrospinae bacterium]|nr:adenylate/guanylate cyclase domain-containing protein [Nitrospinota bacterium]